MIQMVVCYTQRPATRQWDSSRERRSVMRSHVAEAGGLHVSPMSAPCCQVHLSTASCRLEQYLCSLHRPCDLEIVCKQPQHYIVRLSAEPASNFCCCCWSLPVALDNHLKKTTPMFQEKPHLTDVTNCTAKC